MAVLWCVVKMSADRLDRDGSRRPVTSVTDGDDSHTFSPVYFVTVRHEPSRIVVIRANVATRLGSSRSANFLRGRCTLPEVHFRSPFSRHDFLVTVETVGDDS